MKTIFFDCTNGISGDMVLKALMELSGKRDMIKEALRNEHFHGEDHHDAECCNSTGHIHHGRSWNEVRDMIDNSSFSDEAKATALSIYQNIAEAEAAVHGETLETIHFHEVGRDEAIKNALGIGMALEFIKADCADGEEEPIGILTSPVYDGKGTIVCSHGEIPVPVPAVQAMMQRCSYTFRRLEVATEMVTPSGLASLMGIKARPVDKTLQQLLEEPGATLVFQTEAKGSRDTGRDGLRVYLIEA